MGFLEIFLIGVGLSMDAAAISMSTAMAPGKQRSRLFEMAFMFGFFQGLMPLLGYGLCSVFSDVIARMGKLLVFLILGFIGGKMLMDGFSHEEQTTASKFTRTVVIVQAAATSIDAFAVGVGFRAQEVEVFSAALIIAVTTFFIALAAVAIGKRFGDMLGKKAELLGGAILIAIAIKSVF